MSAPVRVLVVDDHVFYREGIKTLLAVRSDEVTVVGEACSGEQAVSMAAELDPDVVLMDLRMPGIGGIAATRQLAAACPAVAVLVLTMIDDDSVLAALRAGARGYLLKDAQVDDVVRAIVAVAHGQSVLAPEAAERVHRQLTRPGSMHDPPFPELTAREHDLLAEVTQGRNNREIALNLGLTEKTVRNYLATILVKLHARDRAQLIVKAREAGYATRD
ncbi:response regulator [Nocardioides limicola]|uniref:response regulator n=1 Tax=Nocardioides limicola TaxID=2803368 RepID=UPI00193C7060|nr:response regulator transcription factor [Nocardioides sp. DJM-14]